MTSAECGHCADSDDGCHGGDSYLTTPPVLLYSHALRPAQPGPDCLGWINYKAYEICRGQSINYPHSTHRHQGHWANVLWDSHITKRLIFLRAVSGSAGKWIGGWLRHKLFRVRVIVAVIFWKLKYSRAPPSKLQLRSLGEQQPIKGVDAISWTTKFGECSL